MASKFSNFHKQTFSKFNYFSYHKCFNLFIYNIDLVYLFGLLIFVCSSYNINKGNFFLAFKTFKVSKRFIFKKDINQILKLEINEMKKI